MVDSEDELWKFRIEQHSSPCQRSLAKGSQTPVLRPSMQIPWQPRHSVTSCRLPTLLSRWVCLSFMFLPLRTVCWMGGIRNADETERPDVEMSDL